MRKHYRRRVPNVQAEEFRPDLNDELPEGIEESLTPGKFWLRSISVLPGRSRPLASGQVIKTGDYIVYWDKERFMLSKLDFEEIYEEA